MSHEIDRRQMLRATVGIAAGLGIAGYAGPAMAGPALDSGPIPPRGLFPLHDPEPDPVLDLPPVPGMLGDRRANEVWYQLDQQTLYQPVPGIIKAYREIEAYVTPQKGGEAGVLFAWLQMSQSPGYPENFAAWATPISDALAFISNLMLDNFDAFYGRRSLNLAYAFAYFGEGVLFDPRRPPNDRVHSMDLAVGFAVLHAYARAFMVLRLGQQQWRELLPLNAFSCALDLIANPSTSTVNPPLPSSVIWETAISMLNLNPHELDRYFQAFPYPPFPSAPAPAVPGRSSWRPWGLP